MSTLKEDLKKQIIEELSLEDVTPGEIEDAAPLFGDEGLGLDSIDALELIILVEKYYGIKISDPKKGKEIFQSIDTLATFIEANRK